MNTPTHLLISSFVLCKPTAPVASPEERQLSRRRNTCVVLGALIPDAVIFVMFFWERLVQGVSEDALWGEIYWQEPWVTSVAIGNSLPVYIGILVIGIAAKADLLRVLAVSALLHLAFDFPFHHDDAHAHLWPVSDWRFVSPISYWNPDHFGGFVAIAEGMLAVALIFLLWRRFSGKLVRGVLIVALLTYIAVPTYFTLAIGS